LKPGQPVLVEERDAAADRVTVRTDGASLALGQRAASKVLVEPKTTGYPAPSTAPTSASNEAMRSSPASSPALEESQ